MTTVRSIVAPFVAQSIPFTNRSLLAACHKAGLQVTIFAVRRITKELTEGRRLKVNQTQYLPGRWASKVA